MKLLPARIEGLETRVLLSATYNLIDLGATSQPSGLGVLDVNDAGSVLAPDGTWIYKNDKAYFTPIGIIGAVAVRLDPQGEAMAGTTLPAPGGYAITLHHKVGSPKHHPHPFLLRAVGVLPSGGPSVGEALDHKTSNVVGQNDVSTPGVETHGILALFHAQNFTYTLVDLNDIKAATQDWVIQSARDLNTAGQILVSGVNSGADQTKRLGILRPKRGGATFTELSGVGDAMIDPQARDLSDMGQVAGSALDALGNPHALLWTGTRGARDLGTLGGSEARALGVNNYGYVVGDATTARNRTHGFLYDPGQGKMIDLNSLIEGSGITIDHAVAISNSNMIAAEGVDAQGVRHAIMLMPKNPTPAPPAGVRYKGGGAVTINGTAGKDHIVVESDPDVPGGLILSLNGKATKFAANQIGSVNINGGDANDLIELKRTDNPLTYVVHGDGGDDQIIATDANCGACSLWGGEGDDLIRGPKTDSRLFGDAGDDTLTGGDFADLLAGGFGDDLLVGGAGNNTLRGEAGNDTITGGSGDEKIDGAAGNDSVMAGDGSDYIATETGDDTIDGGNGGDVIFAGAGDDSVTGGAGDDCISGDNGDDTLFGQAGDDTLAGDIGFGGDQAATGTPLPGNDWLDGGRGNDYLVGSRQSLTLTDDNGRDTFTGGAGGDVINARGDDVIKDANADDIVPVRQTYGTGAFAVQQTAHFQLSMPVDEDHVTSVPTALSLGAGNFAGSPFYLDAGGMLQMRDTVDRKFYLGEFFRNWGVPISLQRHGGTFGRFAVGGVTVKVNGNVVLSIDKTAIHEGDSVEVQVAI